QRLATSGETSSRRLAWGIIRQAPELLTREILSSLLAGLRTHHALRRLRRLEQRIGPNPLIREAVAEREQKLRMRCSRCTAELRRREMIQHLWTAHGLVLHGHRPRDPWDVIEEWIAHFARSGDEKLLERCCELGERADPQHGLLRVYRRFLSRGL